MTFRRAHDAKPLAQIRLQARIVVRTDVAENLLVSLAPGRVKGGRKELPGNALSQAIEVDVGADDANVIESMSEIGKWRDVLKPDDLTGRAVDGNQENSSRRKVANEAALLLRS